MTSLSFLGDLSVVLGVSAIVTLVFYRLGLPFIFGYILAGVLIGPYTPPFSLVSHVESVHTLADLGLVFLMFSLGLEIRLKQLKEVGWTAGFTTVLEVLLMIGVGYWSGRLLGWNDLASVFLGGTLAIGSTTLITRILVERKQWTSPHAKVILGILVMEDFLAVMMIAALSGLAAAGQLEMRAVVMSGAKVVGFVAGVVALGQIAVPAILSRLQKVPSSELLLSVVLGLCFGVTALGVKLGFSVALGAFLTGLIVNEWRGSQKLAELVHPFRDFFSPIFFVAVGMLIRPDEVINYAVPIGLLMVMLVVGKISAVTLGAWLAGIRPVVAFQVGCGLATIGEFSFVIATLGVSSGVMRPETYSMVVAVSLGTSLIVSYLMGHTEEVARTMKRALPPVMIRSVRLYHVWFQAIRWPSWRLSWVKVIQDRLMSLVGSTAVLVGFLWSFPLADQWVTNMLQGEWQWAGRSVLWIATGLAMVIPLLTWVETARVFGEAIHLSGGDFIVRALQFIVTVVGSLLLLVIGSPVLASWPLVIVVAGVVGVVGYLLWNSMSAVQEKIDLRIREWFSAPSVSERTRQELIQSVQERYPGTVEFEDVMVPLGWPSNVYMLDTLKLGETSGAMVMAVFRSEEELVNPDPSTKLSEGDILLMAGERKQIKSAMQYLDACARHTVKGAGPGQWGMDSLEISSTNAMTGKSLEELLKEAGGMVTVVGIHRGEERKAHPPLTEMIAAGDRLIMLGDREAMIRLKQFVASQEVIGEDEAVIWRAFEQR